MKMNRKIWLAAICVVIMSGCAIESPTTKPHKGFEEEVNKIGYEEMWTYERGGIGPWGSIYFFDMNGDGKKEIVVSEYPNVLILDNSGNIIWKKDNVESSAKNVFGGPENERSFLIVNKGKYGRGKLYLIFPDTGEEKLIYETSYSIWGVIIQEETMLINEIFNWFTLIDFEGNELGEFIPIEYELEMHSGILPEDQYLITLKDRYIYRASNGIAVLDRDLNLLWSYKIQYPNAVYVAENEEEIVVLEKIKDKKWGSYLYTFELNGNLKNKVKCDAYRDISGTEMYTTSPLYVGDLENDGVNEIVLSAGVYEMDGTERWSYNIFVESAMGHIPPLEHVEDLNGDGTKEIIAASPDILDLCEDEVILLVFDAEGNVLFNEILFTDGKTSNGIGGLYVEDLNGDGTKEIIVTYDTYEKQGEESVHTYRLVVFGSKEL